MDGEKVEGGCACGAVRYRMEGPPLVVHACHCSQCQTLSGTAFALNVVIEAGRVALLSGEPEPTQVKGASGKPQTILRCPQCRIALWSHYPQAGERIAFVRAGTLDDPARVPPDIHIYTGTKLPWLKLPESARAVPEFYSPGEVWRPESLERWRQVMAG
ncbi:MAG: hypothetical protein QOK17_2926 [Sphingomonadales bacterium]|jgi:hypothetical protein|nr:hypothetical protein [Sphingomonadales bacterium]